MSLIYWTKVKQAIDRTPDYIRARGIYQKATQVDTEGTTTAYQMAMKELETSEQTPPTTLTELDPECKLSPGMKKLGPNNPDQAEQFVTWTNQSRVLFTKFTPFRALHHQGGLQSVD